MVCTEWSRLPHGTSNSARRLNGAIRPRDPAARSCQPGDDPAVIASALGAIARSGNLSELSGRTEMNRESLCKALSADRNPSFAKIVKVARALGLSISFITITITITIA